MDIFVIVVANKSLQNISWTHAATWWQKLAADSPFFNAILSPE
jgi:hypothetical protein